MVIELDFSTQRKTSTHTQTHVGSNSSIHTIVLYCCTGTVLIKYWEHNYETVHTTFFHFTNTNVCRLKYTVCHVQNKNYNKKTTQ